MPRAALRLAALALALAPLLPLLPLAAGCASHSYWSLSGPHGEDVPYRKKISKEKRHDAEWPNAEYTLEGLVDAGGREVLPVAYRAVLLVAADRVVVQREDRSYGMATLPDGREEPARYAAHTTARNAPEPGPGEANVVYLQGEPRPDGRFDITLLVDGEPRPPIRDVGGPSVGSTPAARGDAVWRHHRCLVIHSTAPDGRALSRIHALDGTPLGPPLDRLPALLHVADEEKSYEGRPELLFPGGADLEAGLPYARAVRPLGPDGRPLALPAGALGMIPIPYLDDGRHAAWAIVLDAPEGRRYAVGLGRAAEVASPTAQPALARCEGLRAVDWFWDIPGTSLRERRLFAWKRVGAPGWELVSTHTLQPYPWDSGTKPFPTFEALMARWAALDAAERARVKERLEAARRAEEEAAKRPPTPPAPIVRSKEQIEREHAAAEKVRALVKQGNLAGARAAAVTEYRDAISVPLLREHRYGAADKFALQLYVALALDAGLGDDLSNDDLYAAGNDAPAAFCFRCRDQMVKNFDRDHPAGETHPFHDYGTAAGDQATQGAAATSAYTESLRRYIYGRQDWRPLER